MKKIPIRTIHSKEPGAEGLDSFKIRSIQEVLMGKDMNQDLHRHDFYFILVVSRGKGLHTIDFVDYRITNNTVFMMRPGQVHQLRLQSGSEGYLMEFSKEFQLLSTAPGNLLLRNATSVNYCMLDETGIQPLCSILQSMLEEYRSRQEGYVRVIKANLEIFLIRFLRYRQKGRPDAARSNPYQLEKLQEFLTLLENDIGTKKKVADYADGVHLSPFQLNAITKTLLGKTVAQLIEDQILLEAKRYLLATANQVNQIAFLLGYDDVSYFIRLFKRLTGQTPETFRKNFR
jgi:AraC-like DNA-binding protein